MLYEGSSLYEKTYYYIAQNITPIINIVHIKRSPYLVNNRRRVFVTKI